MAALPNARVMTVLTTTEPEIWRKSISTPIAPNSKGCTRISHTMAILASQLLAYCAMGPAQRCAISSACLCRARYQSACVLSFWKTSQGHRCLSGRVKEAKGAEQSAPVHSRGGKPLSQAREVRMVSSRQATELAPKYSNLHARQSAGNVHRIKLKELKR